MKKILICLIVFSMLISSVSLSILSQTNIAQADSSTRHWEEINNGLYGGIFRALAVDSSSNTVYAGTYWGDRYD